MMLETLQGREQCLAVDKWHAHISVGPELLCAIHDKSYGLIKQFRIEQFKAGKLDVLIDCHEQKNFSVAGDLFRAFFENEFPGLFDINVKPLQKENVGSTSDKHIYFVQHIEQRAMERVIGPMRGQRGSHLTH